jgi:hypothetical protein
MPEPEGSPSGTVGGLDSRPEIYDLRENRGQLEVRNGETALLFIG